MKTTSPWIRGQQAELAKAIGKPRQYINDILTGRRRPSPPMARKISDATVEMKGIFISTDDLLFPDETSNVAITSYRERRQTNAAKDTG